MVNINSKAQYNSYSSYKLELRQRSPTSFTMPHDIENKHTINGTHNLQTQIFYFLVSIKFNITPV